MNVRTADSAIADLYKAYSHYLENFIFQIVQKRSVSEELMHDSFEKLLIMENSLDVTMVKLKSLVFTIARNKALDFLRRQKVEREKLQQIIIEDIGSINEFEEDLEDAFIEGEIISTLYDAIQECNEEEQIVLIQSCFENKTIKTLSKELKISPYKIKKLHRRACTVVAKKIKPLFSIKF